MTEILRVSSETVNFLSVCYITLTYFTGELNLFVTNSPVLASLLQHKVMLSPRLQEYVTRKSTSSVPTDTTP